ncbi:MAG: alpha/beta hydrolase, partial [Myxococcales bacterium]|nr:alpha/beta hydrolase [Myxococcales bacterium]
GIDELEAYDRDGRFLADDFGGSEPWLARFVDYWSGPGTWAELDDEARAPWLRSARKIFEEVRETALDDVPHQAYVEALGALPLLLLAGSESTLAGRRCCEVLARHWHPGPVELQVFADVGHMAPVLAPGEVAARIAMHLPTD